MIAYGIAAALALFAIYDWWRGKRNSEGEPTQPAVAPITSWQIVEPGLIALPTTGIRIRRDPKDGTYHLEHNGAKMRAGMFMTLYDAKVGARELCRDLIGMGLEP